MTVHAAGMLAGYDLSEMKRGFGDPVMDAQAVFRKVLETISYPGRIIQLAASIDFPAPLNMASAAVFLSLADFSTPVWIDAQGSSELASWLRFHCSADIVKRPSEALFALISDPVSIPDLSEFNHGTNLRPDVSATLIVQTSGLGWKKGRKVSGPGIQRTMSIRVDDVPERFWIQRKQMERIFPKGLDVFFSCADSLVALPRTSVVAEK